MTQTFIELDTQTYQSTCQRCGFVFTFNPRYLYGRNYDPSLCQDCKAEPRAAITKNGLRCKPWDGEFDLDTNQPLKDGQPYMPGTRTCGHADCVLRSHVIPAPPKPVAPVKVSAPYRKKYKVRRVPTQVEQLIAEQHDLSYRTGKRLGYGQLLATVKREGRR